MADGGRGREAPEGARWSPVPVTPAFESTAPFAIDPDLEVNVGTQIGRYSIRYIVGAGGMGLVVAAHDPELGRLVAIKLLAGDDEQARRRLVREAQAMARLSHPNVVTVHEVIRSGEGAGIVMELVDGDNLATWREAQPRSWREIVAVYVQAARGLAAAHRARLVHRDFKPSNALIGRDGVVRVSDFGLVRATGPSEHQPADPGGLEQAGRAGALHLTMTRTGAVMGTPAYMAPEQHSGETVDARTDQWALACSLYGALYGQRPFSGATYEELSSAVLAGAVRPEPSDTQVSRAVRAAIRRALARRPADRFASMEELIAALTPARRRWQVAAGVGAAAVVVAFAAAVGAGGDDEATCSGLDAPLVSIWNPARSGALRGRLASAGDGPRRTADRVIAALDGHGSQWIAARTSACTAARQGIDSPELLDRRMRCLDQRLVEMAAVIAALADGDQTVLRGAGEAADGLHAVADCDDPRDTMPRPASARARAEIAAAEDGLAGAWAFHAVDQCEKAIPLADQAAAAGERTGWSPLLARALILRGDCQDRRRRYEGAMETFERAATVGAQARDDAAVVEALAHRFLVLGEHLGRPGEALEGRRFIELALERAGRPPRLRAKWLHFLAIMLLAERRLDEALAAELEAIVLWRQILPAGHIYIMDSLETEANIELFIAGGSRCRFAGVVPISGGRLIQ